MKELFSTIHLMRQQGASRATISKETVKLPSENFKSALDKVTFSSGEKISTSGVKGKKTPEIRCDLVKELQSQLKNGFYKVKADEIAEKIVQKIKDDKDLKII
jgi:anti-sigma28 factor (negative regulator of flagellin synthesis)